jgi:hypothetical protein
MTRRLRLIPALTAIVIALAVAAAAAAAWRSAQPQPQADAPQLSLASKQLHLTQTAANQALIRMFNARPGQVARGTTLVTTTGTASTMQVRTTNLQDIAGPNGGKLIASKRLWIDVRCVAAPCPHNPVVYKGPLALMGTRSVGTWLPGAHRTYSVRVWLLRGGLPPTTSGGDNLYQHSTARFGLVWTAIAI